MVRAVIFQFHSGFNHLPHKLPFRCRGCNLRKPIKKAIQRQRQRQHQPQNRYASPNVRIAPDLRAFGPPFTVGALSDHHKGQSVLIEAFHMLLANYPDARLVLVGEGPDKIRFQQLAKADRRIHFAGFQEEIGSWIASMNVFCFPSREEGLGSSVLDAMALGVPVVSSNVGGLSELIGQEDRGIIVADHDASNWHRSIIRVLEDDTLQPQRLNSGRQFAQTNGIATMTQRYMEIYTEIQEQSRSQNCKPRSTFRFLKS